MASRHEKEVAALRRDIDSTFEKEMKKRKKKSEELSPYQEHLSSIPYGTSDQGSANGMDSSPADLSVGAAALVKDVASNAFGGGVASEILSNVFIIGLGALISRE